MERLITALIFPDFQILDATGPLEAFDVANKFIGSAAPYRVMVTALEAGPVSASSGLQLMAKGTLSDLPQRPDTVIAAGGVGVHEFRRDPRAPAAFRWASGQARRTASVCTGAFLLAQAGLLESKRVTTHWQSASRLAAEFPTLTVEPDAIFIRDGGVATSAGITAGVDLALALIEEDHGHAVAMAVARELVVFLKRPGGQSQFSAELSAQSAASGRFEGLKDWIFANLRRPLSVEVLADQACMSPRSFARHFNEQFGMTPAKFVERLRIDAARRDLQDGALTLDQIAVNRGFQSSDRMRRSFQRSLGVTPQDYRQRFKMESAA